MIYGTFKESEIKEIVYLYTKEKLSTRAIGRKLNVGYKRILGLLKRFRIPIHRDYKHYKKYIVDEDFFWNIDTEQKAYWLGFLYADGNVSKSLNVTKLSLAETDKDHLPKFIKDINSTHEIKIKDESNSYKLYGKNNQNQHMVVIVSAKFAKGLATQGCIPNKTFLLKFPTNNQVPERLLRHFIRGYFDGDGCLTKRLKNRGKLLNKPDYSVQICCNKQFCEEAVNTISKHIQIYTKPRRHTVKDSKNYYIIIAGNNRVKKFLDWIFDNSTVYLNRKYKKYLEFNQDFDIPKATPDKETLIKLAKNRVNIRRKRGDFNVPPFTCNEKGGIYFSTSQAMKELNIKNQGEITKCLHNSNKTTQGLSFRFLMQNEIS